MAAGAPGGRYICLYVYMFKEGRYQYDNYVIC